jgi:hypothetical protein
MWCWQVKGAEVGCGCLEMYKTNGKSSEADREKKEVKGVTDFFLL